jgi:hypothetical protein
MDDREKQQLRKAITAIKAGDKKTGRKLLADLLGENPENTDDFSQTESEVHRTEIDGHIVELDLGPERTSSYFSGILSIYSK